MFDDGKDIILSVLAMIVGVPFCILIFVIYGLFVTVYLIISVIGSICIGIVEILGGRKNEK